MTMNAMVLRFVNARSVVPLPEPAERRARRCRSGLTLADMGELVGVTGATCSRWENAKREPRGALRARYAEVLQALGEIEQ
jgi:transcriptional regulator with XRE-family HTH domain